MTIGIGHNLSGARLKTIVERIERLNQESKGLDADKREVFAEAKLSGFNVKTLKRLIMERRMDPDDRTEQYHLLDLYRGAIEGASSRKRKPAPPTEVVDPDTGEITEEPTAAESAQGRAALGEGHEFDKDQTREEDDAETEQEPGEPSSEEEGEAAAETDPKEPETPVAATWTCTSCGWVGMAAMVTDECPDCGASAQQDEPDLGEEIPAFLDRRGELSG